MTAKLLVGTCAVLLAASVASAREMPPPDVRKDTRALITEQVASERVTAEDFTCSTGHPAGWFAAIVALGLLGRRRLPR